MKHIADKKRWLFMGLGNVIFNEDPAYAHIYLKIFKILQSKDESLTFEKLLSDRDELIKDGDLLPLKSLIQELLSENEQNLLMQDFKNILEKNWLKYNPLNEEVPEFLESVARQYNLGIIANGPPFLRAYLQETGIMKYFKTVVISDEIGIPKPNHGIFEQAFEEAKEYSSEHNENFDPAESFMLGDSLEHDIVPANQLKMKTIFLFWDLDKKYLNSSLTRESTFVQYLEHLKKHSSRRRPPASKEETPAVTIPCLKELQNILLSGEIEMLIKN